MQNLLTLILIFLITSVFSQEADRFTENTDDRPRDPRMDQMNFVPNEVLVKFKDDVIISEGTTLKSAGIGAVDRLLKANGVSSIEKLFPSATRLKSAKIVKDPTGRDMKIPSLHNIYKISVPKLKSTNSAPADIFKFMEEMKTLPEVEYVEPNYIFTIGDYTPAGPEMTMLEAMAQPENDEFSELATGLVPNDPLYNSQWGIPATNIDDVWNTTTGDSSSIIAILDTGVDWQHPDLADNIWKNTQEIPGNGQDEDENGLIDDIRGWDYINNDNNPMDDNSHGTHVAGIAAAVGNNGLGIAGANWKAKIMPIKVIQSSGKGDAATIAKAITYAVSKGAMVINMSFGSYAESLTMKNALVNAYATAVLVAAAGNDVLCIGPGLCPDKQIGLPMYPGAYSFVFGVEANTTEDRAGFSNFDQDGPVFSGYTDLLNYELKAPGTGVLSCVPGGNYREYNGTSMAVPLVAGAVSLYRNQKPYESQELLFGNFINSINHNIDLGAALNIIPEPRLDIVAYTLTDTIDGDRDGQPDAGETIELKVKVRNTWGQANNVKVGLEFGEFEDKSTATIITNEATIGSVSAYASQYNVIPLKIKISKGVADGRDIIFKLKTWYNEHQGAKEIEFLINIENGVELKGIVNRNMTLYPNRSYIITSNLVIPKGIILNIKPGTTLKIGKNVGIMVAGNVFSIGTPDSLITFTKRDMDTGWGGITIDQAGTFNAKYNLIEYINNYNPSSGVTINNLTTTFQSVNFQLTNSIIQNCSGIIGIASIGANSINKCNYINNHYDGYGITSSCKYSNIMHNTCTALNPGYMNAMLADISKLKVFSNNLFSNLSLSGKEMNIVNYPQYDFNIFTLDSMYYGSLNEEKINTSIIDYTELGSGAWYDISKKMKYPSRLAHGIVWKVLVNGKDAQDDFEQLDPIGVAKQKFEVYFNRAMDPKFTPMVTMGVRYPYTQKTVAEDGSWSADSTIYTVYGTIGLNTGDGINTIRVTGAKDIDHFEIPIEDRRFRVVVNAAGSLSEGFEATPGMGNVTLKWQKPDASVSDLMGYNIYRYTYKNNLTTTDTIMINSTIVTDTEYTDFAVEPDTKYFYAYKTVRTNLNESNFSKVVAAIPLTASKGDANGDLSVNVLDVSTTVSYLLSNNPKPFILEAADMNSDKFINVLDIVNLTNVIYFPTISDPDATNKLINLYVTDDILYMDAPRAVAALQFDFRGILSIDDIKKLPTLDGFETSYNQVGDNFRFIAYSLSTRSIPAGTRIPLLKLKRGSGLITSILSDQAGHQIYSNIPTTGLWNFHDNLHGKTAELGQNYPNPTNKSTIIPLNILEPIDEAVIRVVNVHGQQLDVIRLKSPSIGQHLVQWNAGANKGLIAYMLEIRRDNQQFLIDVRKMIVH